MKLSQYANKKSWSPFFYILQWNENSEDSANFWHRKMTLKIITVNVQFSTFNSKRTKRPKTIFHMSSENLNFSAIWEMEWEVRLICLWASLILKLSKCIFLNSYVLSPVVGWCLRLIDVQMDSVRYTYVFGHSIYEPVFFPTVFFFLPLPLTFHVRFWSCMVDGNINYIQIEEMEKHVRKSYSRPFFCNLCSFAILWCWLRW